MSRLVLGARVDPRWLKPTAAGQRRPRAGGSVRGRGAPRRCGLPDLEGPLHVGVEVAAEEVAAGRRGRDVVDDLLRPAERVLSEDLLRGGLVLVDRDVVWRRLLVVER